MSSYRLRCVSTGSKDCVPSCLCTARTEKPSLFSAVQLSREPQTDPLHGTDSREDGSRRHMAQGEGRRPLETMKPEHHRTRYPSLGTGETQRKRNQHLSKTVVLCIHGSINHNSQNTKIHSVLIDPWIDNVIQNHHIDRQTATHAHMHAGTRAHTHTLIHRHRGR